MTAVLSPALTLVAHPYPSVPSSIDGFAECVERLATAIETERLAAGTPASARFEASLPGRVERLVDEWRGRGDLVKIAHILDSDDDMQALRAWARARASLLWPLSPLLYYPDIEEITILARDRILVTRGRDRILFGAPAEWPDDAAVLAFYDRLVSLEGVNGQKMVNETMPAAEFSFGNFRFALLVDPVLSGDSRVGGSIRIPNTARFRTLDDWVRAGTITAGPAEFLRTSVQQRANILISGGTKSGKTTALRLLCREIGPQERVVVIEDSVELNLWQDRGDGRPWVNYVTSMATVPDSEREDPRFSMKFLVRRSLRLAPERIIVGETRGVEAADMVRAMTSGHDGCMTTVHADDPLGAIETLVGFLCESGNFDERMARKRIRQALDLIVQLKQLPSGGKVVTHIWAISRADDDVPVYERDENGALAARQRVIGNLPDRIARRLGAPLEGVVPA
jgi:pilus assembly protein CpaF